MEPLQIVAAGFPAGEVKDDTREDYRNFIESLIFILRKQATLPQNVRDILTTMRVTDADLRSRDSMFSWVHSLTQRVARTIGKRLEDIWFLNRKNASLPIGWGPVLWKLMKTAIQKFPEQPEFDPALVGAYQVMLRLLPRVLPCKDCKAHAATAWETVPLPEDDTSPDWSRKWLQEWDVHVHNAINLFLGKPADWIVDDPRAAAAAKKKPAAKAPARKASRPSKKKVPTVLKRYSARRVQRGGVNRMMRVQTQPRKITRAPARSVSARASATVGSSRTKASSIARNSSRGCGCGGKLFG